MASLANVRIPVTDPIFVTIEARNQLHAAHEAACKALSEYENSHRTPEGWLPVDGVVRALDEKANETCHANHRALRALLSTIPTTFAGVIALIEYVRARQAVVHRLRPIELRCWRRKPGKPTLRR
jgi:hypothetical protein